MPRDIAELLNRLGASVRRAHAVLQEFAHPHVHVERELLVDCLLWFVVEAEFVVRAHAPASSARTASTASDMRCHSFVASFRYAVPRSVRR